MPDHSWKKLLFIAIDAHSKWLEVKLVPKTFTAVTLDTLNTKFATHGLPVISVSDNGTVFTSEDFINFCRTNVISTSDLIL